MITVVVPSYKSHYREFSRLLQTNEKFNTDKDQTIILVVISEDEFEMFNSLKNVYNNLKICIFKDLMKKYLNIHFDDENVFLKKKGPNVFQSLKKLLGMLESETDDIFLTDSETHFIRAISLITEITKFKKTVLYTFKHENNVQTIVVEITRKILECDVNISLPYVGMVFSYQWCFRKEDVFSFFNRYRQRLVDIVILTQLPYFFIEHTFYSFLFLNQQSNNHYSFLNVTEVNNMREHFWADNLNAEKDHDVMRYLLPIHHMFCYSIQNTFNDSRNAQFIQKYDNFKILTSTPTFFTINNGQH